MKITKLGHCCLLIEEGSVRIMTDPGIFTAGEHELVENIAVVLFTHEHADHFHVDSLKLLLQKNPNAKIITNTAVGKLLDAEHIPHTIIEHGQQADVGTVIEGFGTTHAEIYDAIIPRVQNTGYMVAGRLFYPGDDLYVPEKPVEILALPVAGPWLKIKEAIDYAKTVNPKKSFPVHDAILKMASIFHTQPQKALAMVGIEMVLPEEGRIMEF